MADRVTVEILTGFECGLEEGRAEGRLSGIEDFRKAAVEYLLGLTNVSPEWLSSLQPHHRAQHLEVAEALKSAAAALMAMEVNDAYR